MSQIKINKNNYIHNLQTIQKRLSKNTLLMVVLKDNAYGHGLKEMAKIASSHKIKEAIVRDYQEAKKIDKFFENILILAPSKNFSNYKNSFSLAINSLNFLKKVPKEIKIEIKIDTGMHRNGIEMKQLKTALNIIKRRNLNLFGVFTHFRSADELSSELFWQEKNWQEIKNRVIDFCKKNSIKLPRFHSKNSAAIFRSSKKIDEYVRSGIATYGYSEMDEKLFGEFNLKPVLSLWADKISSRELFSRQKVGYGGVFEADSKSIISTYDLGYADGLFRSNPTKKFKIKDGYILGRVSMDYISCNSTKDKICIFDDVREYKRAFNTISYDILVKLSPNIKRVVI